MRNSKGRNGCEKVLFPLEDAPGCVFCHLLCSCCRTTNCTPDVKMSEGFFSGREAPPPPLSEGGTSRNVSHLPPSSDVCVRLDVHSFVFKTSTLTPPARAEPGQNGTVWLCSRGKSTLHVEVLLGGSRGGGGCSTLLCAFCCIYISVRFGVEH